VNYYTEILTRLKTAIGNIEVSTAASISNATWINYHIFDGGRKFIHGQNRGRVPFVNVWRVSSDYSFNAITTSGEQGGQMESNWNIEVVVAKSSAVDEKTGEEFAYAIAQKIIKNLRADYNLALGNERILPIETHPFGLSLIIDLNIINTHSNGDK
jgi:hypothetical protein